MGASEYLELCLEQVRCRRMRPVLEAELKAHVEDQKAAYLTEGKSAKEAEELAVLQMGDPVEAGVAFDRIHRPRMDWKAMGIVLAAILTGIVMYGLLYQEGIIGKVLFVNFLRGTFLGVPVMLAVCFLDYTLLSRFPRTFWWGGVLLTAVAAFLSPHVNGRAMVLWMVILLMPLFSGVVYYYRNQRYLGLVKAVLTLLVSWGILSAFGVMDTASVNGLFVAGCMTVLIMAIVRGDYQIPARTAIGVAVSLVAAIAAVVGYLFFFTEGYRKMRLLAWLNPEKYAESYGYIAVQMNGVREQINWTQKAEVQNQWLTEALLHGENYLFLGMLQGFGIVVSAVIVICLTGMIFVLYRKIWSIKNRLGYLTGIACCCTMLVPLFLHVGINLGLLPVTDSWMPFFAGGIKYCVSFYAVLGLLLSVFRNKDCMPEPGMAIFKKRDGLSIALPGGKIVCKWVADSSK